MLVIKISVYLGVLVFANFLVLWFGQKGLIITAALLIPFDFVMRCTFHETWQGKGLIVRLGALILVASFLTYIINKDTKVIALASACGFLFAQIAAGVFYQCFLKQAQIIKVNGSDLVGIVFDTVVFQLIAFSGIDVVVFTSQVALKATGGVVWYYLIFVKGKFEVKK